jgi:hypothetical protein
MRDYQKKIVLFDAIMQEEIPLPSPELINLVPDVTSENGPENFAANLGQFTFLN